MLVVRDSLSLLCGAGPTSWLKPSEVGLSHESLKLLSAVKSQVPRSRHVKTKVLSLHLCVENLWAAVPPSEKKNQDLRQERTNPQQMLIKTSELVCVNLGA